MPAAMRLAVVSVEAADLERLQQLLDQVRSQLTRPWLWAASEGDADVLVIDVDSLYGHMDWLRAHGQGRRVVCLTGRPGNEHDVTLTRPISAQGLLSALRHFEQAASRPESPAPAIEESAPVEPVAPVEPAAPVEAAASEPAPEPEAQAPAPPPPAPSPPPAAPSRLTPRAMPILRPKAEVAPPEILAPSGGGPDRLPLADFCTPAALPEPAKLERPGMPVLIVDTASDSYYTSGATLKPLLGYCTGTIARGEWQPVAPSELEAARGVGMQPLPRLVWLHTLVNSHGHLLDGLDVNARYRLTRWPQIEREFPKHFRIATVMMKSPTTLTEIAEQSGSSIADVVDFVNAYATLGVVEPEGAQAAPAPAGTGEASGGGLLARLRGLRRG